MVQCFVELDDISNRTVNIVKAKNSLGNKSDALNKLIHEYTQQILEPQFRPEFEKSIEEARKGPFRKVKDFGKEFGLRT